MSTRKSWLISAEVEPFCREPTFAPQSKRISVNSVSADFWNRVTEMTVAPLSFASFAISTMSRVAPEYEKITATSSFSMVAALINCWLTISEQYTFGYILWNLFIAFIAVSIEAPTTKKRIRFALDIASIAIPTSFIYRREKLS